MDCSARGSWCVRCAVGAWGRGAERIELAQSGLHLRLGAAAAPAELELDRAARSNTALLQRAAHRFAGVIERERPAGRANLLLNDA